VRLGRPLEIGAAIRLEGLPAGTNAAARVVNCISIGDYKKFWLLGLALDKPGNVWDIHTPPEDWERLQPMSSHRVSSISQVPGTSSSKAPSVADRVLLGAYTRPATV
jgi:hypothetical protein